MIVRLCRSVSVLPLRFIATTGRWLGVGFHRTSYFVYDRQRGESNWHLHCGPYATAAQAEDWIRALHETEGPHEPRR